MGKRINIRNDPAFRYNTNLFFQFIEESHRRAVNREKEKLGLADAKTVHLIIKPLVIGELAEQWILPGYAKENGREDFKILKAHYDGEGTNTRHVRDAVNWHKNLSYRNERALSVETFYSKVQNMWNLFARNGEPVTDQAKICWLLDRVTDPSLQLIKSSIAIAIQQDPDCLVWNFEKVAETIQDHVSTAQATAGAAKVATVATS